MIDRVKCQPWSGLDEENVSIGYSIGESTGDDLFNCELFQINL